MSARSTTYLAAITLAIGFCGGTVTAAELDQYFNNAYRWAWRRPKDRPWSEAIKFASVTVQSGGYINWSDMEYAENWRLWTEDPRPYGSVAVAVDSTHDSTGIWPTGNQLTTLFAEYLPRVPAFTSTAWNSGTAYVVDDVVYYTDGNCYRAIQAGTNHTPSSSPTYWQVQPVLNVLQSAVALETAHQYKRGIVSEEASSILHADAEEDLQDEWTKDDRPHVTRSFPPLSWR